MGTWLEFINGVNGAMTEFKVRWGETAIPFFRGHGDISWTLRPGIFRQQYRKYAEAALYYEFRTTAGLLLEHNLSSWDVAFFMQHYGLPTRLLDWTETFAVALYFAITECKHEASIFFLDPYSLNKLTCGQDEILDLDADFKNDYYGYFIDDALKGEAFPGNVIAIYPPRRNSRILAQKGVFTLHNHEQPLDTMYAQCIRRFDLSAEALDEAKRFLELSGVNDYAIFPDLEGLSRHLKKRYATLIRG